METVVALIRSSYRREVIKTYVLPSTILLMFTHLTSSLLIVLLLPFLSPYIHLLPNF